MCIRDRLSRALRSPLRSCSGLSRARLQSAPAITNWLRLWLDCPRNVISLGPTQTVRKRAVRKLGGGSEI
eukprot:2987506-Alexandrium_andersonii.AAC.1